MTNVTRIQLHYSLPALRTERARLARIQYKEYTTRGNTQKCQELFAQIERLDKEIERRLNGG